MKKVIILLFFSLGFYTLIEAQEEAVFSVEVSTDSILLGNYIEVKFQLENANGANFEAPEFEGFKIVSGPNMSSNYSIVNGEVSQSMAYTYYIEPVEVGNYFIAPASIKISDKIIETEPIEVLVVPNPDGIVQEIPSKRERFRSPFDDPFFSNPRFKEPKDLKKEQEKTKKKTKRKTYKI